MNKKSYLIKFNRASSSIKFSGSREAPAPSRRKCSIILSSESAPLRRSECVSKKLPESAPVFRTPVRK